MEIKQICAIWKIEAEVKQIDEYNYEVFSPRAGGKYQTSDITSIHLRDNLTDDRRIKLTDWLIEQREAGVEVPYIDEGVLQDIKTRPEKVRSECIKSLMLFLAKKYEIFELIEANDKDTRMMLMAYSSSLSRNKMIGYLSYCASKGYLERKNGTLVHFFLTVEGQIYTEGIGKEDKQKRQCFVAMWFNKSMDDVYEKAIEPAIRDAGYEPYRVDKDHHIERIDEKIITQIRESGFIIADFTSEEEKPRGGVYYEAGFAHGLGLKVIWTCREDRIGGVHLDTRQYNHILWNDDNLQDFYDRIYLTIRKTIGENENTKEQGTSFVEHKPKLSKNKTQNPISRINRPLGHIGSGTPGLVVGSALTKLHKKPQ